MFSYSKMVQNMISNDGHLTTYVIILLIAQTATAHVKSFRFKFSFERKCVLGDLFQEGSCVDMLSDQLWKMRKKANRLCTLLLSFRFKLYFQQLCRIENSVQQKRSVFHSGLQLNTSFTCTIFYVRRHLTLYMVCRWTSFQ